MRRLALILALLFAPCAVFAQAVIPPAGTVPVQEIAPRGNVATGVQSVSPAVAGQQTLTIPAGGANIYAYITMIDAAACMDGTASASDVNKAWTTTNLGSLTFQTSVDSAATITTNAGALLCDRHVMTFPTGLRTASPNTATTIVSPASNAKVAYPMLVTYYYAN